MTISDTKTSRRRAAKRSRKADMGSASESSLVGRLAKAHADTASPPPQRKRKPAKAGAPNDRRESSSGHQGESTAEKAGADGPDAGAGTHAAESRRDNEASPRRAQEPRSPAPESGTADDSVRLPDFEALSRNMAKLVEETGNAIAAYVKPIEDGHSGAGLARQVEDAVKTLGHIAEYWFADPRRALEAQTALSGDFLSLWANTLRRFSGEAAAPMAPAEPNDKRFADPEWRRNPLFDFLRQAYGLSSRWVGDLVTRADVDERTREKAQFYVRQLVSALSPSNFIATNPELIRETIQRNGENLVRGMRMLTEDIEAGGGQIKIRQTDASRLRLGVEMAATPGKVVYRNDLMELIQYTPTTEKVFRRPLLITPPWINKYYILDLNPEKSFVRWAVSEGLTVFVISWVNPDARHAAKSFEDYMREGVFAAIEAIEAATGERQVAAIGYCVGGTLLSAALASMALSGDDRVANATLLTTQVDFRDAGDLKLFVDEARVREVEESMSARGYLEGSHMASAFNMLRPTELIWNYVVNNYLKGKEPAPFDLLAWNSDSTRMPAANHSFYLRNCYLENKLARGEMEIGGRRIDLGKVTIPVYNLATKEDHIAPARSVYVGAQLFGGSMRYVMAGSGHIAGVVNPVSKPKYQFWTGPRPQGLAYEDWLLAARESQGTWWPDWLAWLVGQAPEKVDARSPGDGALAPICDAPGDYVRVRA